MKGSAGEPVDLKESREVTLRPLAAGIRTLNWWMAMSAAVLIAAGCRKHPVVSSSMSPTIKRGEQVTVDYTAYTFGDPKRWDVIVFLAPRSSNVLWAMRIVAMPGESVTSSATGIEVNGKLLVPPSHVSNVTYQSVIQLGHAHGVPSPFIVPKDSFFCPRGQLHQRKRQSILGSCRVVQHTGEGAEQMRPNYAPVAMQRPVQLLRVLAFLRPCVKKAST